MVHSIMFATKGIPLIYNGDEIGLLNDVSYVTEPLRR